MPNTFAILATGIFDSEFAGDTGIVTVSQISGWLASNLGQLNVKLHTNFSGEASEMDESAGGIFSLMYLRDYNKRAARNALRGVETAGGNVLSIGDNDNRISFINRKEVAKEYQTAAKDLSEEIDKLAYNYCYHGASPRQIAGYDATISGSGFFYYYPY